MQLVVLFLSCSFHFLLFLLIQFLHSYFVADENDIREKNTTADEQTFGLVASSCTPS